MRLRRAWVGTGVAVTAAAGALLWWSGDENQTATHRADVELTTTPSAFSAPAPQATSSTQLASTLRAQPRPPSPELLRDNREAQAAYDASAQPGDFVIPPSVSVEH